MNSLKRRLSQHFNEIHIAILNIFRLISNMELSYAKYDLKIHEVT